MQNAYKQSFKRSDAQTPEIAVYNCGLQSCEGGHTWGPGIRDHYLIHLVIGGQGSYTVNGRRYTVKAGEIFFASPGQLITYTADTQNPWEYYWVGFNGTAAPRLCQELPFTDDAPICTSADAEAARELLHSIYRSIGPRAADEAAMNGYLYLFIAMLMRQRQGRTARPDSATGYVMDAVQFIQFNYSHNIGVDDIARAVGISRSHLYRAFKKNVDKSPIDYLTEFRIGEACKLLQTTSLSVAEIALSTGFFDQFYFSRVFKKQMGVAPSRYLASLENK